MAKISKDPFKVEKLRDDLAKGSKLNVLKKTYSKIYYPEIKDNNSPSFWDNLNMRSHVGKKESPMAHDKLKLIGDFIKKKDGKFLNVGCGAGDLEHHVFGKGGKPRVDWTGIDISEKSLQKCKKEFKNGNFKKGDVRNMEFPENYFDFVIVLEVLEHIQPSETFKAYKNLTKVLKRNGTLIITIPINEGLEEMVRRGKNPNAHLRVYTSNLIKAEIELAGFKIEKAKFIWAFHRFYRLKSFIVRYLLRGYRDPNGIIVFAKLK